MLLEQPVLLKLTAYQISIIFGHLIKIYGKTNNSDKANELNQHFSKVCQEHIRTDIDNSIDPEDYQPSFTPPIFDIRTIDTNDVAKVIDNLKSSKSCSYDGITSQLVKYAKHEIAPLLVFIYNLSIKEKKFPNLWNEAQVTPLFKAGNADDPSNYRPISILPTLGKVLERLVHDQLYHRLSINNLLTARQSGLRKGYSMGTCIVDLMNDIYNKIDTGGACEVLFLDLSKAFDMVNHTILNTKLKALGVKESTLEWFCSYLNNRQQHTVVDSSLSDPVHMTSGVPQGSILGPLLFVCYTNDLPNFCENLGPFIYADDTTLLATGDSLDELDIKIQSDFDNLNNWFKVNHLSVNPKKSKLMVFCRDRSRFKGSHLTVHSGDTLIETVDNFKYLGVHLDSHLSFDTHIDKLITKVNQRT